MNRRTDRQTQSRVSCSLSCPVLSCPVLSCPVLSCPVLSCPVLSCPVLSCPVLSCPRPAGLVGLGWHREVAVLVVVTLAPRRGRHQGHRARCGVQAAVPRPSLRPLLVQHCLRLPRSQTRFGLPDPQQQHLRRPRLHVRVCAACKKRQRSEHEEYGE
jgi:hypothetical protein